jgi:predicted nucleic acid-binding protein
MEEIIQDSKIAPVAGPEAREWGTYVNGLRWPVPLLDNLIAGTALANDLGLVAEHSHDFPGASTTDPTGP